MASIESTHLANLVVPLYLDCKPRRVHVIFVCVCAGVRRACEMDNRIELFWKVGRAFAKSRLCGMEKGERKKQFIQSVFSMRVMMAVHDWMRMNEWMREW